MCAAHDDATKTYCIMQHTGSHMHWRVAAWSADIRHSNSWLRHDSAPWQVLGWHLSVEASMHPGAHGFGWFFRYLTFYSFSLQFATLGLSCLSDIAREVRDHLVSSPPMGAAAQNSSGARKASIRAEPFHT